MGPTVTILALAIASAAVAGCLILSVVVNHQRHTIERTLDRVHPEVLRPETCCGACPPIALYSLAHGWDGPMWDCTCADNPNCPNYQGEHHD